MFKQNKNTRFQISAKVRSRRSSSSLGSFSASASSASSASSAFLAACLLLVSSLTLLSCKELFYAKARVENMKQVAMLSIVFNETSYADTEIPLKFPDATFFVESYTSALLENFNDNEKNVELLPISANELKEMLKSSSFSNYPYTLLESGTLFMRQAPSEAELAAFQEILRNVNNSLSYSMVLVLNSSIWAQTISGKMYVYGPKNEVAWSEKLEYNSGYIVNDAGSDHLMRNEYLYKMPNTDSRHESELKKVASDLGKITADSFKESLALIYKKKRL